MTVMMSIASLGADLSQDRSAKLAAVFATTTDAMLISDGSGTIVMANQQVERLLGYTMAELIGLPIDGLVPGRFRVKHPVQRADYAASPISRRMGYGMPVKALRKDGSECDVEISLSRIQTDEGPYFSSSFRDMDSNLQAFVALQASEAWFRSIFENNLTGISATDVDGRITRFNDSFRALLGFDVEALMQMNVRDLTHPDDYPLEKWYFDQVLAGKREHFEITKRYLNFAKQTVWVDLSVSVVRDSHGEVINFVSVTRDITEAKVAAERIRELAFFDQLTGLPNRTLLMDRLMQVMTVSARSEESGALLFIDLDNFKSLNDTLGHHMGDVLLKQVAQRLARCVRAGDTVARLGGDEFVVVLAGLDANATMAGKVTIAVARKILKEVSSPYQLANKTHRSTASIGITIFRGQQTSIDELLRQSDLAMYKAKDAGRNGLCFFNASMEVAVKKRAALEDDLRHAIESNQFLLHYQAQVGSRNELMGAEVLLRWLHPERGMVSPLDFISLAEETGLILPLGHWVLATACKQLALWALRPEMAHLSLSVNVSALQFRQNNFVTQVMAVLKDTGANPHRLKLELTESLLVDDIEKIIKKMVLLKTKGVSFSLDDFGTGYSSLTYLKRLPLNQLKIDQSFVSDVLTNPNDAAIAKTIVTMGQSLGLEVIAEGVETEEQKKFLATHCCHAYQGYLFSRPLHINDFEVFSRLNLAADF